MELFLTLLLLTVGIVLIVKGGDFFVDAASWIAEVSGIPKLIIGATVVSIATTLPEMLVSVMAAVQGKVDMSVGNAVGSVTANTGLILALALLFMPSVVRRREFTPKALLLFGASALIVACGLFGQINVWLSILLLIVFGAFVFENVSSAKRAMALEKDVQTPEERAALRARKTIIVNILKFIGGAAGIVIGADLLVDNASVLARMIGISERVIGVTIVAVGTSLPELITTVTAIVKKQSALSVGNILGANILDLTLIMPLSSVIAGKPLVINSASALVDLPVCLLVGLIAIVPTLISSRLRRWQGFTLLGVYAAYLGVTCFLL